MLEKLIQVIIRLILLGLW